MGSRQARSMTERIKQAPRRSTASPAPVKRRTKKKMEPTAQHALAQQVPVLQIVVNWLEMTVAEMPDVTATSLLLMARDELESAVGFCGAFGVPPWSSPQEPSDVI